MKFTNIYNETEENLRLALLSLWTPGKHPMRQSLVDLFQREPIISEPVFQSTFGWETVSDDTWKNYLNADVINRLEIGVKHTPYKHQAESWKSLEENKSIVVTSGTGSGKTECFMYPVISDLYEQGHTNAIQAIFIYPLNALMEDQKNRLSKYCTSAGLSFAVYNGSTPEYTENPIRLAGEVGTRDDIRDPKENGTRPQILLSNPSMLEYILVRQKDQIMLQKSRGKLRWIIIDEAHSYSGSAALELSNQIKRILEAFDVRPENIRFACTSATIGGSEGTKTLKEFISTIIGQEIENINIIGGNRIVPSIPQQDLQEILDKENLSIESQRVLELRTLINDQAGLTLRQIWERIYPKKPYNIQHALHVIDRLCEMRVNGDPLLSLRGHFFMRAISGLYACGNEGCVGTSKTPYGYITTNKSLVCPHCGRPLLELVQCKRCGSFILMGQSDPQSHLVSPYEEGVNHDDYFSIDDDPDDEFIDRQDVDNSRADVFFALPISKESKFNPLSTARLSSFNFVSFGSREKLEIMSDGSGKWKDLRKDVRHSYCPKCGRLAHGKRMNFKYFRIPLNFINQTISPVLLKECAPENHFWGKYIAFTDSRQGTAISAKTYNIEVERRLCREKVVDELAKREASNTVSQIDLSDPMYANLSPDVLKIIQNAVGNQIQSGIKLYDLAGKIFDEQLFEHITDIRDDSEERKAYRFALVRSFIGQKQVYQNDAENMGILTLDYPQLHAAKLPESLSDLAEDFNAKIEDKDWQSFLKIILDYVMRASNHIQPLITYERKYVRDTSLSTPIFKEDWIKVKRGVNNIVTGRQQHRLVVLLCAALGIDTVKKLEKVSRKIDNVFDDAWDYLVKNKILTPVTMHENTGYNNPIFYQNSKYVGSYYLDLSPEETNNVCVIKRPLKGWICPVTGAILDTIFCGYSPTIVGEISHGLFDLYRINSEPIPLPNKPADSSKIAEWLLSDVGLKAMHDTGLWTDRHKYAYLTFPTYIAAEHSAQQSKELLAFYTKKFKENTINVLHCSTTMEMGVDIGDIDIVLMDTIPPTAANYLQRVGRAGRMGQTKSVAFSLCNNTPIGQYAYSNPMWALQATNGMAPVKASQTILQRHINSYFFRQFICVQNEGLDVTTSVGSFMDGNNSMCDVFVDYLEMKSTDNAFQEKFYEVFGKGVSFTIDCTVLAIKSIKNTYLNVISELEDAYEQFKNDEKRKQAITIQLKRYKHESLLNYLSEQQFIPNANMPTGVCTFDFTDKGQSSQLFSLYKKLEEIKTAIESADKTKKTELQIKKNKLQSKIQSLKLNTQATRDIRTALNEYAPEQTIVVNEKNYVSAGITLFGAYNDATQSRAIYFCEHCGRIEYTTSMDETKVCPRCRNNFHAIIGDTNNVSYTRAYEPIGFRTDQNKDSSREEQTEKKYYEINPILLSVDWCKPTCINMCQIAASGETGEILFYNAGNGHGFAFCKRCGRASVELSDRGKIPFNVQPGHKCLWSQKSDQTCEANENDIVRHAVFTGRLQTCYSVLRFNKNPEANKFEKDKTFVLSMGVILKRALCLYLGIDEAEIDFGYKEELEATSLFIYDTARGGCGYSLHFSNEVECNQIFDIARTLLSEYNCNCHIHGGACSKCLIDRNNYRYANMLDKARIVEWLLRQKKEKVSLPANVISKSPKARVVYQTLKSFVKDAVENSEVNSLSFFVSDMSGEFAINDWSSVKSAMGRLINKAVQNGKGIEVIVEYHSELHSNMEDKYPYATLKDRIPDCNIRLIGDMGALKTALIVNYRDGRTNRFFTTDSNALPFSGNWGNDLKCLFVDDVVPALNDIAFPKLDEIGNSKTIIREGLAKPVSFKIKNYFSEVIAASILNVEDMSKLERILQNRHVSITFSDMYVNSAQASLMLTYLIKELQNIFSLNIDFITLQLDSPRRKCNNERYNDYSYIYMNWPSEQEADSYTFRLLQEVVGTEPEKSMFDADHHRYLRITTNNGDIVEIRPDHSIAGGWKSNSTYMNVDMLGGDVTVRRTEDVLYYVIIKEK